MNEQDARSYVAAASRLLDLPLTGDHTARVAVHLQRTADIAAALESFSLAPHDEPAELFNPAPFDQPR
ncbi:DUF4089 domain-containing protein [Falsiroseomonas sp.]|uniref:DUF4089 domain-containing protein n=1 Tax=Falsiroseomonas sp. TaxID=2870721 RepID=UPI002721203C|nr:DUF4089 domain-containing protein [Falsiroseomonas sp.]MDO9503563.1 DUF4089 domain-containing protein [Falsiroseomonas sp.]